MKYPIKNWPGKKTAKQIKYYDILAVSDKPAWLILHAIDRYYEVVKFSV